MQKIKPGRNINKPVVAYRQFIFVFLLVGVVWEVLSWERESRHLSWHCQKKAAVQKRTHLQLAETTAVIT